MPGWLPLFAPSANVNSWFPLRVGAGGWLRSMDVALSDNTMVALTDTYGAWYWNPAGAKPLPVGGTGVWEQLCNPTRFNGTEPASVTPDGQETFTGNGGVWAIRIANSSTSTFYMVYLGRLYKSTDKGTTWTRLSSFTAVSSGEVPGNGGSAQYGPHMAVDPINASRFIFGTATASYKSTDGSTVSAISTASIAAATGSGAYGVVYDPRVAAQSGGNTQIVYVFSDGNGLYKSSDGGGTWAIQNASGMPTTFRDVVVNPNNGDVYVVDGTSSLSNVKKYNGTAWSSVTATSTGVPFTTIAFDPTNSSNAILFSQGANLLQVAISSNGGSSFTTNFSGTLVATDLPWLAVDHPGLNPGRCCYDNSGAVFLSDGIGIWKMSTTPPTSGAFNLTSQTAGIEQLITNQIISPPGGNPVVTSWDRAAFVITNPKSYPTTYFPGSNWTGTTANEIVHGWGCDYASADPTFICVFTDNPTGGQNSPPFYSTNKGASWNFMTGAPSPIRQGGAIAASTTQNMVAITSNNGSIYYTTNQGATWNSLETYFNTNFSVPTIASGNTGWGNAYYDNRQYVCADRVAANTFYAYNNNSTANGGGIYRSTNSGAAWTRMNNNNQNGTPFTGNYGSLKSVPQLGLSTNTTGHLFFTAGQSSAAFGAHPSTQPLYRSTDGGANWSSANALVNEAYAVGFGANPGGSYPAVGFCGWYNGVGGVWVSKDNCATFTKIGNLSLYGTSDYVSTMTGDSNTVDVWYVGLHNSGSAYYGP